MFTNGLWRRKLVWLAVYVTLSTAPSVARAGPLEDELANRVLEQGRSLSSEGAYASRLLNSTDDPRSQADARFPSGRDAFAGGPPSPTPASRREWRTPPLWAIRDSGPYLHDGRAETLEQAIALHGGEALKTRNRYFRLQPDERVCF
jgi:hypothetical protein